MARPGRSALALTLLLAGAIGAGFAPARAAVPELDLLLLHGRIWTGTGREVYPASLAVWHGRIVAIGPGTKLQGLKGPDTRVIDLHGALMLPGFIDTHVHLSSAGHLLLGVNLLDVQDEASFVAAVRAGDQRMPAGAWLVGGDWSAYQLWPKGADHPVQGGVRLFEPHRRMVDEFTPERPMLLSRFDRKVWFANGAALAAAGLDATSPDPPGGALGRDPDGSLTGVLRGSAVDLVQAVVPEPTHEQRLAETLLALQRVRENGVTTLHDMSPAWQLRIYQELLARGELTVRVHYRPMLPQYRSIADVGITAGFGGDWIKLGAVKGHIDGIMGNSTALFFEPYAHQPGNRGRLRDEMFPEGTMQRLLNEADAAGLQITVHAIGDAANHMLLNMVERMIQVNGPRDRRFRVVHAQVLSPQDIPRFGKMKLIAEVQPYHAIDDMRWMEERIGERARTAYAFRSLQQAGALLAFGSDWPGTNAAWYPISPLLGIYAAVTRQTLDGKPAGGWFPQERITVQDALLAYTRNNAFAGYEEDDKGTLEVGKLADITVVDRNLLAIDPPQIRDAHVLYTIVDGRVVWAMEQPHE